MSGLENINGHNFFKVSLRGYCITWTAMSYIVLCREGLCSAVHVWVARIPAWAAAADDDDGDGTEVMVSCIVM